MPASNRLIISIRKPIHRYPTIHPRSEYNEVKTYSGPIGSVRFMNGDRSLVTVGGTDASLMIWDIIEE